MSRLLKCPECEGAMHIAMIDVDGTNLEEGYECEECDNIIFECSLNGSPKRFVDEDTEYRGTDGKTIAVSAIKRHTSKIINSDGVEVDMRNDELIRLEEV